MNTLFFLILIIIACLLLVGFLVFKNIKSSKAQIDLKSVITSYEVKYKGIFNVDKEIQKRTKEFENKKEKYQNDINSSKQELDTLKSKYKIAKEVFTDLTIQNNLLKDTLEISDYGIYEPHFDLETSDEFREKLTKNKNNQKRLIKSGVAATCNTNWVVGESQRKGESMIKKAIKLTLRAFNGECDALISKVKWNNIEQSELRIQRTFDAINKLNSSQDIHIKERYLNSKIEELRLTYEYTLKIHEEKEEQRRIREQMREEEKAQKDFEKARKEAEKEEKLLKKAMEKATEEIAQSSEAERAKYEEKLANLQNELQDIKEKNQRALSMAQKTKSGHVYIISNIGSFGNNIYKIGMTRRLEPLDRVKELGGASVPFKFDVHAMIYSDNAPELENKLHKTFSQKRVNQINMRREYFDISLEEIEKVVNENYGKFEFIKEAEAKEYRETLIIKKRRRSKDEESKNREAEIEKMFPNTKELF